MMVVFGLGGRMRMECGKNKSGLERGGFPGYKKVSQAGGWKEKRSICSFQKRRPSSDSWRWLPEN